MGREAWGKRGKNIIVRAKTQAVLRWLGSPARIVYCKSSKTLTVVPVDCSKIYFSKHPCFEESWKGKRLSLFTFFFSSTYPGWPLACFLLACISWSPCGSCLVSCSNQQFAPTAPSATPQRGPWSPSRPSSSQPSPLWWSGSASGKAAELRGTNGREKAMRLAKATVILHVACGVKN